MSHAIVAIDIGAESGRVMLGRAGSDELEELHRFPNGGMRQGATWRWDLPRLFQGICDGLAAAAARGPVASVGIDTWGVDYGLLDERGELLEAPWHHRDLRTEGVPEQVHQAIPAAELFHRTGLAPLPFNTLYQLVAHRRDDPAILRRAARFAFVGDILHHWLCRAPLRCEHAIAGSAMMLAQGRPAWDLDLLRRLDLPADLLPPVAPSGAVLGRMTPELTRSLGFAEAPRIITPPVHDTAAAAACADAPGDAYLSCGTWSLVGCTVPAQVVSDAAFAAGLSNEVAADGRPRLNRNIMGLWIIQRLRAAIAEAGRDIDYARLTELAAAAPAAAATLDVDDRRFFPAEGPPMPERIAAWYRERGLPAPAGDGALARAVIDGLAAAYARAVADLASHSGQPVRRLVLLGGGTRNRLLVEATRRVCPVPVALGPVEATALGNLRVQAAALAGS